MFFRTFAGMRISFIILSLCLLFGCKSDPKPDGLIPKDKFIETLTDIRIMEAAYAVSFKSKDSVHVSVRALYDSLFQVNGISEKNFIDSYRYYARNPEEISAVEDKVMENLSNKLIDYEQEVKPGGEQDTTSVSAVDSVK